MPPAARSRASAMAKRQHSSILSFFEPKRRAEEPDGHREAERRETDREFMNINIVFKYLRTRNYNFYTGLLAAPVRTSLYNDMYTLGVFSASNPQTLSV